jgi:hypothetical protein
MASASARASSSPGTSPILMRVIAVLLVGLGVCAAVGVALRVLV